MANSGSLHSSVRFGASPENFAVLWMVGLKLLKRSFDLATEAGFADQAHMIRRMRQYTGFTPEQLRESAGNNEAFWGYRLLRQYFTKPEDQ